MSLFGRKVDPVPQTQPEITQQPLAAPSVEDIVTRVFEKIAPLLPQQQQQVQTQPQAADPVDDIDPDERQRIARVATDVTRNLTDPYANIFNAAMPGLVRDSVVNSLTEGQKVIYHKYKAEVDAGVARAAQYNPALQAVPDIHRNAINLVIGAHADEIESLVISRLTPQDLPIGFTVPNSNSAAGNAADAPTTSEQEWVGFFAPRSRQRDWDVEKMREFKSIKPAFLHEMVAEYKSRKEQQ